MRVRRSGLIGVAHFARVGIVWTNAAAVDAMEESIAHFLPVMRAFAADFFFRRLCGLVEEIIGFVRGIAFYEHRTDLAP